MAVLSTLSSSFSDAFDLEKAEHWHREHGSLSSLYQAINEHNASLKEYGGNFIFLDSSRSEIHSEGLHFEWEDPCTSSGTMDIDESSGYPSPPQQKPLLPTSASTKSVSTSVDDGFAASALLDLFGASSFDSSAAVQVFDVAEQGTFLALSAPSVPSPSPTAAAKAPSALVSQKRKGYEELVGSKRARINELLPDSGCSWTEGYSRIGSFLNENSSASTLSVGLLTPPPSSPPFEHFSDDDEEEDLVEIQGSDGAVYSYIEILWVHDESDTHPGIPSIVIQEPNEADPNFALTQLGTDTRMLFVLPHDVVEENRKRDLSLKKQREREERRARKRASSQVLWK